MRVHQPHGSRTGTPSPSGGPGRVLTASGISGTQDPERLSRPSASSRSAGSTAASDPEQRVVLPSPVSERLVLTRAGTRRAWRSCGGPRGTCRPPAGLRAAPRRTRGDRWRTGRGCQSGHLGAIRLPAPDPALRCFALSIRHQVEQLAPFHVDQGGPEVLDAPLAGLHEEVPVEPEGADRGEGSGSSIRTLPKASTGVTVASQAEPRRHLVDGPTLLAPRRSPIVQACRSGQSRPGDPLVDLGSRTHRACRLWTAPPALVPMEADWRAEGGQVDEGDDSPPLERGQQPQDGSRPASIRLDVELDQVVGVSVRAEHRHVRQADSSSLTWPDQPRVMKGACADRASSERVIRGSRTGGPRPLRSEEPVWELPVDLGTDPITGGAAAVPDVHGPARAADQALRDMVDQQAPSRSDGDGTNFGQLLDQWLEESERLELRPRRCGRSGPGGAHHRFRTGEGPTRPAHPQNLDAVYRAMKEAGKSPKTIRDHHAIISTASTRPCAGVGSGPTLRRERSRAPFAQRVSVPPLEVVRTVMDAAERRDPGWSVADARRVTDVRRVSSAALRWSNVDLEGRSDRVARSVVVVPNGLVEKSTKTGRIAALRSIRSASPCWRNTASGCRNRVREAARRSRRTPRLLAFRWKRPHPSVPTTSRAS